MNSQILARGGSIAGSQRRDGISRNVLIGGLAALVLASFSVFGLFMFWNGAPNPTEQLETAMRLMRKGDSEAPYRIAKSIAPKLLKKRADMSKREFLIGVGDRKAAEAIVQRRIANEKNEQAVKHLENSRELSFPDGYEGQGNYYLGMALYDLFRWDEAEEPLEVAAERWPQGRADAIERMIDIDLSFANQDPDAALARIKHWRSLPRSAPTEVERMAVKEMQTLYSQGKYARAAKLRDEIPRDSPHRPNADLIHGRCMQRQSKVATDPDKSKGLLELAIADFQDVLSSSKSSVTERRQSSLELARAIRDAGNRTAAVSAFSALRLSSPFEPESLVSGLEEIDSLIDLGRMSDAANTIEHMTKNFGELQWYYNDWMPFSKMQSQVVASGERMIASKDFSAAAKFASNLPPFCDELDRLRMNSKLYEQWAMSIDRQKDSSLNKKYHQIAAEAYESLSNKLMRATEYDDLLWRAIENYRLSGAFKKSNQLLENYLRFESRENQPKGLLVMARNFNAMERPDLAMLSLNRIIESNTSTSLIYDARLEAAKINTAKENYQEAEELAIQNLYYGDLTPSSPIWRESLFLLSDVLYRRGLKLFNQAQEAMIRDPNKSYENLAIIEKSYDELRRSIERTRDGLRRFKDDPQRLQTLYRMAKAYKMASSWPELLLREERNANDDTLSKWKALRKELLMESKNAYSQIVQEITASSNELAKETNAENLLLCSYFGVADLLYEAGAYEEAIDAYQEVSAHFIGEPESLEAMTQIAASQKKLGKIPESIRTLQMARDVLSRIPPEKNSRFSAVTSLDRLGWQQHLDWLIKDLSSK